MARSRKNKRFAAVMSLMVITAAISVVVNTSFSAGQYYRTVEETQKDAASLVGEKFRVAGKVLPGSIIVAPTATPDYRFIVHDEKGGKVHVHYAKAVPDTFKEGVEVVVEGELIDGALFEASHVVAKCPSKYEGTLTQEEVARKEAEAAQQAPALSGSNKAN